MGCRTGEIFMCLDDFRVVFLIKVISFLKIECESETAIFQEFKLILGVEYTHFTNGG